MPSTSDFTPDIIDVAVSDTVPAKTLTSTVETQTDPVVIQQVRHYADASVLTEDITIAMNVVNDHSYVKVPSQLIDHPEIPFSLPTSSDDPVSVCNSENSAIGIDDEDDVSSVNSHNLGADDADYVMTDSSTSDDKSSSSSSDSSGKSKQYVVSENNLLTLFSTCNKPNCHKPLISKPSIKVYGFAVAVTTECIDGHSFHWESQSKINHIYESNLLFPSALFLTGHSFNVFEEMCSLVNLCSLSSRHCYNIQRAYILPEIKEVWTCHSEAIMSSLHGERVVASGDARCDSPGHNASFGTYSIMDTKSRLIIAQETIRVTDVKNSYWMEVEGLKQCLDKLNDHGVEICTLATDRHPSVRKTMADDYPQIRHEYDLWHIVKSLKKKLLSAKKADIVPWINAIANHLWYCASACDGDPRLMKEMWMSLLHHIKNSHSWTAGAELYRECNHPAYTSEEEHTTPWLIEGSEAFTLAQKTVLDRRLLRDLESVTQCIHTGELESIHSLFLKYAPKRKAFSREGIMARLHLATIDHNTNTQVRFRIVKEFAQMRLHVTINASDKNG